MATSVPLGHVSMGSGKLRPIKPNELFPSKSDRIQRTSVILPSQHQSYAVCVEFAKEWFLEKFDPQFFNSVYVDGTHSFDEFRKFSNLDDKLKRTNPLLAIIPVIDMNNNRDWIDSTPEMPMLLQRSRMEGTFFNDNRSNRGLHLQLIFKTITVNCTYKIRLNTRAEEMDMMEFIKLKHRAGFTESRPLELDIHVPKGIISQIAMDNAIPMDAEGNPKDPIEMLEYLNSYSVIPFIYKLRCSTGNSEYFIKVPNCMVHIKAELPTMDDGDRQDMITTNYNIDFNVEFQMSAPYCYTYFSQHEHEHIPEKPVTMDATVALMAAVKADIPAEDENHWPLLTRDYTEYILSDEEYDELKDADSYKIDLKPLFANSDIGLVMNYTRKIKVAPAVFMNFLILNDTIWREWTMDWDNMVMTINGPPRNPRTIIALYINQKYVNDTLIFIKELKDNPSRIY